MIETPNETPDETPEFYGDSTAAEEAAATTYDAYIAAGAPGHRAFTAAKEAAARTGANLYQAIAAANSAELSNAAFYATDEYAQPVTPYNPDAADDDPAEGWTQDPAAALARLANPEPYNPEPYDDDDLAESLHRDEPAGRGYLAGMIAEGNRREREQSARMYGESASAPEPDE